MRASLCRVFHTRAANVAARSYSAPTTSSPLSVQRHGDVAVIHMNDQQSPVNVGNERFMVAMRNEFDALENDVRHLASARAGEAGAVASCLWSCKLCVYVCVRA